ncbi:hypothetical protein [Microbacterium sp. GXF7504]
MTETATPQPLLAATGAGLAPALPIGLALLAVGGVIAAIRRARPEEVPQED